MNTNDFCLTFLYCSVENSNINNKTGEINLPTSLSMLFFSDSFLAICPLHDLVQAAPRKVLHERHTRGQVNSLSGACMRPCGLTH